jgi:hypothetical protein
MTNYFFIWRVRFDYSGEHASIRLSVSVVASALKAQRLAIFGTSTLCHDDLAPGRAWEGLEEGPKSSTLSYANAKLPWQLFESLFYDQPALAQSLAPKKKLRVKNKLLSLDATVIDLHLSMAFTVRDAS